MSGMVSSGGGILMHVPFSQAGVPGLAHLGSGQGFCCSQGPQIVFHASWRAVCSVFVTGHTLHMGQKQPSTLVTNVLYLVMVHSTSKEQSSPGGGASLGAHEIGFTH